MIALLSCGGTDANDQSADPLDSTDKKAQKATEPPVDNDLINSSNMLMALDQLGERLVIYDLDAYEDGKKLDDLETFAIKTGHAAGLRYREDTVLGNVILVAGSNTAIYSYPTGKRLWYTRTPGSNPHSIEMLPSGNIVEDCRTVDTHIIV